MKSDFVDPKVMHGPFVYCMNFGGPKDCFGHLHCISFNLYDENRYTSKPHFKCKCDKCGHEVFLPYDPDRPTILY